MYDEGSIGGGTIAASGGGVLATTGIGFTVGGYQVGLGALVAAALVLVVAGAILLRIGRRNSRHPVAIGGDNGGGNIYTSGRTPFWRRRS